MPYLKFENLIKNTPLLSDFFENLIKNTPLLSDFFSAVPKKKTRYATGLSQYIKETHVDNECKNAVNVLGSQWMELVLLPKILENRECIFELKVNKNRLYPEKRRYGVPYWYIHCACKLKMCGVYVIPTHVKATQ